MSAEYPGWIISPDHHSAFVRTFRATPAEPLDVEYSTSERRRGRWVDATYVARVIGVYIRHQWDQDKGAWWSAASVRTRLVNTQTDDFYKSGWRDGVISIPGDDKDVAHIPPGLIELTHPRSVVSVTEVPA